MNRDHALSLLRQHKRQLERQFGVLKLALFGSMARDSATGRSDADVLVGFDATVRTIKWVREAASPVPDDVRLGAADVPRRRVIATRNRLIHACLGIDNDTLRASSRQTLRHCVRPCEG